MTDTEKDPERLADELEREANELQRRSDELQDDVQEAREDWTRKRSDAAVPGAVPDSEEPSADKPSQESG
jgi:hypothetical protein